MLNGYKLLSLMLFSSSLFCFDAATTFDKVVVQFIASTGGTPRVLEVNKGEAYSDIVKRLLNVSFDICGIQSSLRYAAIPPRTSGKIYTDWVAVEEKTEITSHNTKERFFEGNGKVTDETLAALKKIDYLSVLVIYKEHAAISGEKRPE